MTGRVAAAADRALAALAALLLAALLLTVLAGVAARTVAHPLAWSEETAQHLLVWTGFVGLVIAARRGSHIRIEAVPNRLPPRLRRTLAVLLQGLVIVFAALLLGEGPALVARNWDVEWVSLPLPAALLYLPVPVAAAALILASLAEITVLLRREGGR